MKQESILKRITVLFALIGIVGFFCFYKSNVSSMSSNNKEMIQDKGMSVAEFQEKVSKDKLVLVYFNASWCAPCAKLKPEIIELEKETAGYCEVLQINIDDHPKIAEYYEINSLPMFVLYKNGKKLWENIGASTKIQLQSKIESFSK